MEYLLIKQPWIDLVRREHWFCEECVAYPTNRFSPKFLRGAYFIPEFRIKAHDRCSSLYIGAYETISHARLQLQRDYASL